MEQASKPPILLTIAGFDPSNGAGITADLQVFAAHGCFGISAITALTVQSTRGVRGIQPVSPEVLASTLAELQTDLPPAGIKIGMLGSVAAVQVVADFLEGLALRPPVVLDPVLRSSSGTGLLDVAGIEALQAKLLPLVDWATPNWTELAVLSGQAVGSEEEAGAAMARLALRYPALGMIATGGELAEPTDLLRLADGACYIVAGEHVETTSMHGTGCAYSSALLCGLVAGAVPTQAATGAKRYVEGALRNAPGLGSGRGPMNLLCPRVNPSSHQMK